MASGAAITFRSVPDGCLVQTADIRGLLDEDLRVVSRRAPTRDELEGMRYGWEVARFVKSNAIVYAARDRTLGIGAGQMSRVDAARFGASMARDAGSDLEGCAVASDAFFPFPDGLLAAADAGARAAIQPGGSVRDAEVIAAADERGMAMAFTGVRHFRH
jgi:phosphoribosylaminoimidazolecarboxamide formyltransferase/IMP cyclohydrolase